MGMQENPSSGYVIKVSTLAEHFLDDVEDHRRLAKLLDDCDYDEIRKLLEKAIPYNIPCPSSVFILSDVDTGDGELETGVAYAWFDEEDLYEKQEKAELIRLRKEIGEVPTLHSWTMYG